MEQTIGPKRSIAYYNEAIGSHTQDSSIDTATSISVPAGSTHILIHAETQNARLTLDGTTPTTSLGFLLTAGNDYYVFPVVKGGTVTVISATSGASVDYQFMSL